MADIRSHQEGELEKMVKKMRVHYRFIPFLHLDYIFANFPLAQIPPFNQFHNFRKFQGDVYQY